MISYIREVLFNKPQGRPNSLVQLGVSLFFLCMFVYYWSVGKAGEFLFLPFFFVSALCGFADSLPETRRQAASILRLIGLVVLVSVMVITIVTPELIFN